MAGQRFFRYGELPLVLLYLLDQEPLRGFDLMSELDRLFGPRYRASAGTVYPALGALEAEGLLSRDGSDPHRYTLTDIGQKSLDERQTMLAAIENRTGVPLSSSGDLSAALRRFTARIAPLAGRVNVDAVEAILDEAANEISRLLSNPGGLRARRSV